MSLVSWQADLRQFINRLMSDRGATIYEGAPVTACKVYPVSFAACPAKLLMCLTRNVHQKKSIPRGL